MVSEEDPPEKPIDAPEKPINPPEKPKTFEELGVCKELCQAVQQLGWKAPTPIQQETIPYALEGRDIIALAKTGSGKTGAFALPVIQALLDAPQPRFAVVMAPTRELAFQIGEQFTALGAQISLKVAILVGGMNEAAQALELTR